MKLMVTGGAGFIGSAVIRAAMKNPAINILNIDKLTYAGHLSTVEPFVDPTRYKFLKADICNGPIMEQIIDEFQPDIVMHLAAESHVDRSIDGPDQFLQTNLFGTYHLLQASLKYYRSLPAAKKEGFRFHHISTDEVFGSLGETGWFTETSPYDPRSPYSATKAGSDHLVSAWYHTYGLPILITNCSNNYGPYQFPEKLIPVMILKALRGEPLPVYGNGSNIRDWLHVEDHARALLLVAQQGKIGQTYNIGGHNEKTNLQVVEAICELVDQLAPTNSIGSRHDLISFVKDRPGHDQRYAIDASKIERDLGWTPLETFSSGLKKTVQWYIAESEKWVKDIQNQTHIGYRQGVDSPVSTSY